MPNAVIVPGLPRCATTALVNILSQHPELTVGIQKEPHFFIPDVLRNALYTFEGDGTKSSFSKLGFCVTDEEYSGNYTSDGGTWIDASTLYSAHPSSIEEISKYGFEQVRFVVMFRGALKRAWSHYNFSVSRGEEYRSFEDALREEQKGPSDWLLGGYIESGRVAPVVKKINEYFGHGSLYLVDVDTVDITSSEFLSDLLSFLGIESLKLDTNVYPNGSEQMRYKWVQSIRISLRKVRQSNPVLFDNKLTRWAFERFISLAPKAEAEALPTLEASYNKLFSDVDAENQLLYEEWRRLR
jgi:hypothetical protein